MATSTDCEAPPINRPRGSVPTAFFNGLPGFVTLEADGELQRTALEIEDGKLAAIHVARNPDKSRHLRQARH